MANEIYAVFSTTEGKFKIRLFAAQAPRTVENFVSLAEGSQDRQAFLRRDHFSPRDSELHDPGRDPEGTGRGGPGYKFADEFHPDLKHTKPGVLSMANAGPDTNGSQFFVTVAATPWLDNRHTVFGEVTEGYDGGGADFEDAARLPGPSFEGCEDPFRQDREGVAAPPGSRCDWRSSVAPSTRFTTPTSRWPARLFAISAWTACCSSPPPIRRTRAA